MAPVAFAVFTIAVVWPLQKWLQARVPRILAMLATVLVTVLVVLALSSLVIWSFGRAAQWLIASAARFQEFYASITAWLESHDLYVASLFAQHFNFGWMVRAAQQITGRFHAILTFWVIVLVFVALGLLEIDALRERVQRMGRQKGAPLLAAAADICAKFQRYMIIRTVMSVATGISVWALATWAGIDLALEWGLIAFVLNYIPFLGPLVATVFPTFFTAVQFESWQYALAMFVGLNAIQFLLGSYLEPRIAGNSLSLSPFMVLFAVFFWTFLWGIPGAFIGVPILIAIVAFMDRNKNLRPISLLLGSRGVAETR
jgi:predicted PurR-regulated permease PerM